METVRRVQAELKRLGLSLHPTMVFHICRHAPNLDWAIKEAVETAELVALRYERTK
jgi:hypothetical protein